YTLTVDLPAQTVTTPDGAAFRFEIDPFRKRCLLQGPDEIGLTLEPADAIRAYGARRRQEAPGLFARCARGYLSELTRERGGKSDSVVRHSTIAAAEDGFRIRRAGRSRSIRSDGT